MSFYDLHLFCCQNERPPEHPRPCCGLARGEAIRQRFAQELRRVGYDRPFRVNKAGCLDRCELGPCIVLYPEGVWYRITDIEQDIPRIVREHILQGHPVEALRLPNPQDPARDIP